MSLTCYWDILGRPHCPLCVPALNAGLGLSIPVRAWCTDQVRTSGEGHENFSLLCS